MKKNLYKFLLAFIVIIGLSPKQIIGQCVSTFNNPSGTINVSPMLQTIVSGNMFPGDYAVINISTAGDYQVNTSFATSLNITDNSNVSLASGNNALSVNFPSAGLYRIHVCSSNSGGSRIVAISPRNRAFNFDGTNDFIDCGIGVTNTLKGKDKFTVEAWVYPTQNTIGKSIIGNHQSNTQFDIQQANDKYSFFIGFGAYSVITASNTVVLNTWQHIAGVFDDNILKFYINGVLSGTTAVPSSYVLNSSCNTNVWIGKSGFGGEEFQGSVDEVRIWDRAVCQGEIQKNMNGIIPTTATNLLANYHFEHGVIGGNNSTVTTLVDYSGNAYNGTVMNALLNGTTSNWVASAAYPANGSYPLVDVAPAYTAPSVSISGANGICNGASTTFTASGNVSTYNWLSGPTTATNSVSPTTTTTYSVVGTNSLGCLSNTATITLTVSSISTSSVVTNVSCNGGTNGSATVTATGGISPYTYLASNGSTLSAQSGLMAGTYTYTITDNIGCIKTQALAITQPTALSLTASASNPTICSGASSTLTANGTGGTGTITYTWVGGPTNSTYVVSPTSPTNYTVNITDANSCTKTATVGVVANVCAAGAALNFDGTNDFVNIPNNSSFNFGTNDFTIETWAKTTISTGNRVMIGKINGGNNFWLGVNNGKATFSLIGGTDAIGTSTIGDGNWHHIAAVRQSGVVSLYVDGVLEATQNNNGTATIAANLTLGNFNGGFFFPGSLDEVRIWNRGLCKGEILNNKNAELPSSQIGLVAYYNFNQGIDNSNNSAVTSLTDLSGNANNGTLNNFALSGTTSNWVAPGAVTSGSAAPTYTPVSASISSQVNLLCNGYNNGSFDLTPSGGTAPYTFVWSNSFTSEDMAGLAAGIYSVTVTDAKMCRGTQTVIITEPAALVVSAVASATTICANEVATVTISATGGTTAYSGVGTYTTNAAANNYTVTDANNCAATATVNIIVNPLPTVTVNSGAICAGQSFTMVPSGATTYTYSSGTDVVTPSANDSYTITGTDANGCENTVVSTVTVNVCTAAAALNFDGTNDRVNLGTGLTTGLTGGTKVSVEAWVKPTSLSGLGVIIGNYNNTASGNLQILLRRNYNLYYEFWIGNGGNWYQTGSVVTPTLNVWQHVAGTWDGTVASIYVNGVLSGTTTPALTSLGNGGSNQVWIGSNSLSESFTGNIDEVRVWNVVRTQCEINTYKNCEIPTTATGLIANYHFNQGNDAGTNTSVTTLTDASASAFTGTLTNMNLTGVTSNWVAPGGVVSGNSTPSNITPTVTVNSGSICAGQSFTMVPSGASTYTYSNGTDVVMPSANDSYTVTGTDANGCENTAVSTVTVNALPTVSVNSGAICAGQSFTMTPTGASTYTYSNGTDVVTPSANDSYTVTGTDANGCENTTVSTVTVNALPVLTAVTNNTLICTGQTATLTASGATTYTWSTTENTTSVAVSPTVQTTYTVNGTDANGCSNNTTVTQDVSTCAGIETLSNDASINVYPNPNTGLFIIELTSASKVTVMNALGQVVIAETFEAGKHTVNINNESTGVYFVKVMTNNKQQIIKVIKE